MWKPKIGSCITIGRDALDILELMSEWLLNIGAVDMKSFLVSLLVFVAFGGQSAKAGPGSTGGGNDLVDKFVSFANAILNRYPGDSEEKALLATALKNSHIVSVPVLKDIETGNPIPDQKLLVAWSSTNSIQLKEASGKPGEASWEDLIKNKKPVAHQIVHELYRASGAVNSNGKSPDDSYQISIGKLHLDTSFIPIQEGEYYPMTDTANKCAIKISFVGSQSIGATFVNTAVYLGEGRGVGSDCDSRNQPVLQCNSGNPLQCQYSGQTYDRDPTFPNYNSPWTWTGIESYTFTFASPLILTGLHQLVSAQYLDGRPYPYLDFDKYFGDYQYAEDSYPKLHQLVKSSNFYVKNDQSPYKNCVRHIEINDDSHSIVLATSTRQGSKSQCEAPSVVVANCRSLNNAYQCRSVDSFYGAGYFHGKYEFITFLSDGSFVSKWVQSLYSPDGQSDKFYPLK